MDLLNHSIFGDPKRILLALAGEHHLPELLPLTARLLGEADSIALARIWLIRPPAAGDCQACRLAAECPQQETCLHLAASFGNSKTTPDVHWESLDGDFRRFPIGVRKVGHIADAGKIIHVDKIADESEWIVRHDWAASEAITSFIGLPLIYRGTTLGVLALFSREAIGPSCSAWLRMIADHLSAAIANAQAIDEIESLRRQLEQENAYLKEEVTQTSFGELVGQSPALSTVSQQIDLVAPTDSSVLIFGESGTGKELVARELHGRSERSAKPLIKVNCAAIPRELYESEFFGHTKGSFTGAVRDRVGRFELADGGTLFLDEIGEIPLDLQAKLLRILQEGELERIGEERTRRVNVRIIAATNRNLKEESASGRFRQDLYYRLSVFPIELPPLRDRIEDIPLLASHFLAQLSRRVGRPKLKLTIANVQQLQRYHWPGNIRELQHVLERAVILSTGKQLRFDLPQPESSSTTRAKQDLSSDSQSTSQPILTAQQMRDFEAQNIRRALEATDGKLYGPDGAAELLGMKPTTLASRLKKLESQ